MERATVPAPFRQQNSRHKRQSPGGWLRHRVSAPATVLLRSAAARLHLIHETSKAKLTDHNIDTEPDPSMILPSPVIYKPTGIIRTIVTIGITINAADGISPSASSICSAETSTIGVAPGQSTSPFRVRSSAFFMGPMSRFFQMTTADRMIATIA